MRERKFSVIGSRLREVRKVLKLSQKEFVQNLGIIDSTLSEYETGFKMPTTEFLMNLRQEYSVNISYILFGEGGMFVGSRDKEKYCIQFSKLGIRQEDAYEFLYTLQRSRITQHHAISQFTSLMLKEQTMIKRELEIAEQEEKESKTTK